VNTLRVAAEEQYAALEECAREAQAAGSTQWEALLEEARLERLAFLDAVTHRYETLLGEQQRAKVMSALRCTSSANVLCGVR
jgi:hypothetical protein